MSARRGAGMPARSAAVNFDGSINTGLTIRTIRMKDGLAEVRVGATCLFDSDPAAEDRECQVKAAALFQALRGDPPKPLSAVAPDATGSGKRVLLIDHDDSFVHMLADYFRQVGAAVTVVRHVHAQHMLNTQSYDLLVLSPGPGRPEDFGMAKTIDTALGRKLPMFGVCLGRAGDRRIFRRPARPARATGAWAAVARPGARRAADAESAQ